MWEECEECKMQLECDRCYDNGKPSCAQRVIVAQNSTSTNTAMLQLLGELRDYLGCGVENRKSDIDFIDRIDVALAQQQHS